VRSAAPDHVEWGVATRRRHGEPACGDVAVVVVRTDGALIAGIDGVGHGPEAARAAHAAAAVVREAVGHDLVRLMLRCHEALRATRGAAISLAFVSTRGQSMTWLGVGNVEGRVLSGDPAATRPKGSLPLRGGLPGHELPHVQPSTLDVRAGDVVLMATDGIHPTFADSPETSGSAQAITERIMAAHWRPSDDAMVVAVRCLGPRS
jgi:negative regulator of sigma-B (phosphoserine phosphatase)